MLVVEKIIVRVMRPRSHSARLTLREGGMRGEASAQRHTHRLVLVSGSQNGSVDMAEATSIWVRAQNSEALVIGIHMQRRVGDGLVANPDDRCWVSNCVRNRPTMGVWKEDAPPRLGPTTSSSSIKGLSRSSKSVSSLFISTTTPTTSFLAMALPMRPLARES